MNEFDEPTGDALDRFLDGDPSAVPELSAFAHALQSPATPDELAQQHVAVDAMLSALNASHVAVQPRGTTMMSKLKTRTAALTCLGSLLFGGAAYAATASGALDPILGASEETAEPATTTTAIGEPGGETTTTVDSGEPTTTTVGEPTTTVDPACSEAKNHGEYVRDVARDHDSSDDDETDETTATTGDSDADDADEADEVDDDSNHGDDVSEAAHSDCGKHDDSDEADDDDSEGDHDADGDHDAPGNSGEHRQDGDDDASESHGRGKSDEHRQDDSTPTTGKGKSADHGNDDDKGKSDD